MVGRKDFHSGKLEGGVCPACDNKLDGFTAVDHRNDPEPDDVTVCAYCVEILRFDENLKLEIASPELKEELSKNPEFVKMVAAIKKVNLPGKE